MTILVLCMNSQVFSPLCENGHHLDDFDVIEGQGLENRNELALVMDVKGWLLEHHCEPPFKFNGPMIIDTQCEKCLSNHIYGGDRHYRYKLLFTDGLLIDGTELPVVELDNEAPAQ